MSRFVICDGTPGRAFEIVVLSAFERPEKPEQADKPEAKRQRHENDKYFHHDLPCATRRARSAFNMTNSEEPDIAAAAIRGVTTPLMAIGTASRLYPTASQKFCRIRWSALREKSMRRDHRRERLTEEHQIGRGLAEMRSTYR